MQSTHALDAFVDTVIKEKLYSTAGNLRYMLNTVFDGVDLERRRMLDIGGGAGLFSYYAACMGADAVVCLEPEAEGSRGSDAADFRKFQGHPLSNRVRFETAAIQEYNPGKATFDVILLHNSINHLDEPACMALHTSESAREIYRQIFSKVYALTDAAGTLIACDCTRHNFFGDLGIQSPFARWIEWEKHQSPKLWSQLLSEVGFRSPRITWNSPNSLRGPGKLLLRNRLVSYFLLGHFRLQMRKPA